MFYFFKRRPEMSAADFHRYWREHTNGGDHARP
jgi:hypothetical protein